MNAIGPEASRSRGTWCAPVVISVAVGADAFEHHRLDLVEKIENCSGASVLLFECMRREPSSDPSPRLPLKRSAISCSRVGRDRNASRARAELLRELTSTGGGGGGQEVADIVEDELAKWCAEGANNQLVCSSVIVLIRG